MLQIIQRLLPRRILAWRPLGLVSEYRYWRGWVRSGGLSWPEHYRARLDPDSPIAEWLADYVSQLPQPEVSILDVGAGPITAIGYRSGERRLNITAVDQLAPAYDRLLARAAISPPVRTIYGRGETLTQQFGAGAFDITHARNSLDHMADPFRALNEMVDVTRVGGHVILVHAIDEGARNAYLGLHQWNLGLVDGEVILWRPGESINLTRRLQDRCSIRVEEKWGGWLFVAMRRKA